MASRTVSTFATKVTALNDTATELRRSLLDNQTSIRRIDAVARTSFLEPWEGCREDFQRILETSEAAAIKFSAIINYYLSLQEETNDPAEVDETIEELSGFQKRLPQLGLDQVAEFDHLDTCLDKLAGGIFAAVTAQQNSLRDEVENTTGRIPSLEKELEQLYEKRRQKQCEEALARAQELWTTYGAPAFNPETALHYTAQMTHTRAAPPIRVRTEPSTRQLVGGWDFQEEYHIARVEAELKEVRGKLRRAESELQEYKNLDVEEVRGTIETIRRSLATQSELQQDIFSGVKTRLVNESKRYLDALQDGRADGSPAKQLAYRNAKQSILSSSVGWELRARVLVDEYAKKMK